MATTKSNDASFKLAYSPAEAALAPGVGRTTVFALMTYGRLKRAKIGTSTLIPRASLEALLGEEDGAGD